jgi:hypothetical protein
LIQQEANGNYVIATKSQSFNSRQTDNNAFIPSKNYIIPHLLDSSKTEITACVMLCVIQKIIYISDTTLFTCCNLLEAILFFHDNDLKRLYLTILAVV